MIEILPLADHVAAFRIDGKITAEDYDRAVAEVEAKLKAHARIGLYSDMIGFSDITGEALARDFRYSLGKIGEFDRFARSAIVTDKEWVGAVVRFAQAFLPRMDLRTFDPSERDAAMAWIAEPL